MVRGNAAMVVGIYGFCGLFRRPCSGFMIPLTTISPINLMVVDPYEHLLGLSIKLYFLTAAKSRFMLQMWWAQLWPHTLELSL